MTEADHIKRERGDLQRITADQVAYRRFDDPRFGNRLGLRFANGRMKSLPYLQLVETDFDPDIGVILTFVGHEVTISGRNLRELYFELEEEAVGVLYERHHYHDLTPADPEEADRRRRECYIDKISMRKI